MRKALFILRLKGEERTEETLGMPGANDRRWIVTGWKRVGVVGGIVKKKV